MPFASVFFDFMCVILCVCACTLVFILFPEWAIKDLPPVQSSAEVTFRGPLNLRYRWQLRLGSENTVLAVKCTIQRKKSKGFSLFNLGFDFCFRAINLSSVEEGGAGTD